MASLQKYKMMLKIGLAEGAVRAKMKQEGFDDDKIDELFNSGAVAAAPPSPAPANAAPPPSGGAPAPASIAAPAPSAGPGQLRSVRNCETPLCVAYNGCAQHFNR